MLATQTLKAFIPTTQPEKAKQFYEKTLGLKLVSEDGFASEFDVNGTPFRLTTVQSFQPQPFTVLGWKVKDIYTVISDLKNKGVAFEKYDFVVQDEHGVWTAPGGTKVAWFKDVDGNLLSLDE